VIAVLLPVVTSESAGKLNSWIANDKPLTLSTLVWVINALAAFVNPLYAACAAAITAALSNAGVALNSLICNSTFAAVNLA